MHKSMQMYSQTFPGHIQNPLRGHFPCYAMTSGLLMIGANLPRPTWFLPLLSFPLPPTPFPPGPDTPPPPTPLMSSRQTEVEQQFSPTATRSIFDVVTLPLALAYIPVSLSECVCVCVRVKTDQGECVCMCVCRFWLGSMCASVCLAPEQCPLDPAGAKKTNKKNPCVQISKRTWRHCIRMCVFQCVVLGEMMGRQMSDSSDSRREALWSTLRRCEDGGEGEVVVTVSTVTSLNRPLTLSLSKNHSYSRRSEELKREIRFHVVKRFRRRNNSYQTQGEGSQVLTRGSSSGSG